MSEAVEQSVDDSLPAQTPIDPFSYFPARQSRLGRLGGTESFSDPSYVFHTHYQDSAPGPLTFKVTIADLTASYGTLVLRVNVIPVDLRFDPKLAKTAPVSLPLLAESGGEISIEVMAKEGMLYALLGHIYEDTDANAAAIAITVQQAANQGLAADQLQGNEETLYHAPESGGAVHLISGSPASLKNPVSQTCTPAQLVERSFAKWVALFRDENEPPERLWSKVYVLQSLKTYGMLESGARGLALGYPPADELPAIMASAGCSLVLFQQTGVEGALPVSDFPSPRICDPDLFEQLVSTAHSSDGEIPAELGRFDFLWSQALCDRLGSISEAEAFLAKSLLYLNVGGIAVHTFTLGVTPHVSQSDYKNGLILPRFAVERVAIDLISHGHEVSQIRYDKAAFLPSRWSSIRAHASTVRDGIEVVQFGLIIRKGHG